MDNKRVLVIGDASSCETVCWKLASSTKVETIFVDPDNVGISKEQKVSVADVKVNDFKAVATFCKQNSVGLVVVGPKDSLANGMADELAKEGIPCFGPTKAAAQIEANKDWSKAFMDRHKIPTACWHSFSDPVDAKDFIKSAPFPALVVKASGLAAGKGVVVAADNQEACKAVDSILTKREFGVAGDVVVIEELLVGEEVSVLAFSDGTNVKLMLPAQDHKRLMAEDKGPNTGGMGAYCPYPFITDEELKLVEEQVLKRTVDGLKSEGTPFVGVLRAVLMMTTKGPKLRKLKLGFGDLETQVILPLLDTDLYDIMMACCGGYLPDLQVKWKVYLLNAFDNMLKGSMIALQRVQQLEKEVASLKQKDAEKESVLVAIQAHMKKAEKKTRVRDLQIAKFNLFNMTHPWQAALDVHYPPTAMTAIQTIRPPLYRNTSYDSLSKYLLVNMFDQHNEGNLVVPFSIFYEAIAVLLLVDAGDFIGLDLQKAARSRLFLAGGAVDLHLLWLLKALEDVGIIMKANMNIVCNNDFFKAEPDFVECLRILNIKVEVGSGTKNPLLMLIIAKVRLEINLWNIFEPCNTSDDIFYCDNGEERKVEMMKSNSFKAVCGSWNFATTIAFPIESERKLKLLFIVPKEGHRLEEIEKSFPNLLMHTQANAQTPLKLVQLRMPRLLVSSKIAGDLAKLIVELSQQGHSGDLADKNKINYSFMTEVNFSDYSPEDTRRPPMKRLKPIEPEVTLSLNKPFAFVVYYRDQFALLAGRVSRPEKLLKATSQPLRDQPQSLVTTQHTSHSKQLIETGFQHGSAAESKAQGQAPLLSHITIGGSVINSAKPGEQSASSHQDVASQQVAQGTTLNTNSTSIHLAEGSTLSLLSSATIHGDVNIFMPKKD